MRTGRCVVSVVAALALLAGCEATTEVTPGDPVLTAGPNPAAPGFDAAGSDPRAVTLADDVMQRMGGRRAWDDTRYIAFCFFGGRRHVWDRHTGDIRVEGKDRDSGASYVVLMNLHSGEGRAWLDGDLVTDQTQHDAMLEGAVGAWINDAYWLVMPYKLKDTGVTLRALGARPMKDGRMADVVSLTFADVGVTPENMYHVYVAQDSGLVEQWDFYARADDGEPRFQIPWHGWTRYGKIMLSGDRGDGRRLTEIGVYERLPAGVLRDPAVSMPR
jgi:hypothetical protein